MSDVRQQLLSGIQTDTDSPAGLPLVKVAKGARRGAGQVWGKVLASGIDPSVTAHDVLKTETVSGQLRAIWQHLHLADLPAGSANLVFVEDGSGAPALALLINANVDPAAALAYSKLNLNNSIMGTDIVNGQIGGALGNGKITAASVHNNDIGPTAAIDRNKLAPDPCSRAQTPNGAANTSAVAFGVIFTAVLYQNTAYCTWNGASAISAMLSGTYNMTASVIWPPNATGYRQCGIRYNGSINGGLVSQLTVGAGFSTCQQVTEQRRLNSGDYMEMICMQTSGGSLPPAADARACITMEYISA
jgi:hypothetical protein